MAQSSLMGMRPVEARRHNLFKGAPIRGQLAIVVGGRGMIAAPDFTWAVTDLHTLDQAVCKKKTGTIKTAGRPRSSADGVSVVNRGLEKFGKIV